jgi:hypothetical protein
MLSLLVSLRNALARVEATRVGRVLAAALVGISLLGAAALYVAPARACINHGCWYTELAADPWHSPTSNAVRLRWLSPAIGHYLHLTGRRYIWVALAMAALLLALVYAYYRARRFGVAASAGLATAMAFSTCVLCTLHFQGYSDTTSYVLLFLAMISAPCAPLWPLWLGLAILNHESNVSALPWLLLLAWIRGRRGATRVLGPLWALAVVWLAFRLRTAAIGGGGNLSAEYYLSRANVEENVGHVLKLLPVGAFMTFKLLWWLPFAALVTELRKRRFLHVLLFLGILGSAVSQLLVASDTSRLLALAFPAVLLGAETMRRELGEGRFVRKLGALVAWGLLVPTYYVGQESMIPLVPLPAQHLVEKAGKVDIPKQWWGNCDYGC